MLTPDNSREIQAFALQSLDPMIEDVIRKIMAAPDMLMAIFNIIEYYNFPFEIQASQFKVLDAISNTMNEARAQDLLKKNGLQRLVKCYG